MGSVDFDGTGVWRCERMNCSVGQTLTIKKSKELCYSDQNAQRSGKHLSFEDPERFLGGKEAEDKQKH